MKKLVVIIMAICLLACLLCVPSFALTVSSDDVIRVYGQKADGTNIILNGYKSFAEGWEAAIDYAEDHSSMEENGYERIVVELLADWKADDDGEFGPSSGDGFQYSAIHVTSDTKITINMNGHTINRGLSDWKWNGEVMYVDEDADLIINNGTITGGNSGGGAGGIYIDDARVELNNVHIVGNVADNDYGGGIAIHDGATLIMNGGSFTDNKLVGYVSTSDHEIFDRADYGGAIYADKSTAEFNNVEFKNNQTTTNGNHGAAIYATDSNIKISGCVFDGNGIEDKSNDVYAAHSVIYAEDSQLHIIGSTFINNGAKKDDVSKIKYSSLIVLDDSVLQMEKGEDGTKNKFSNNNSYFLINDIDSSEICVWDTDFLNNASSVLYGDNQTVSDSYFNRCKFSNNVSGKFVSFYDVNTTLTFNDCDMGDSTYGEKKYFKFVENGVEKRAAVGSVFGEGSLAMIVAFVSLIASVAAIVVNVSSKKQNTLTATANETAGDEE